MNPATVFSAVVAVLSVGSANAIFGADIITATGASSGLGTSVILASGPGIPAAAAVVGAGLLLKAGALLVLNQSRSKRSAEEDTDNEHEVEYEEVSTEDEVEYEEVSAEDESQEIIVVSTED